MKKNAIFWYDLSKLSLSLQSIPLPKAHKKAGGQGDIYILRRNWTLWFWRVRTSQLQTECQEQSNGDALQGVLYTALFGFEQMLVGREEELYTHLRGAFSVVHWKTIFLICYLLDYQQVQESSNVSIILSGDKKEPTKWKTNLVQQILLPNNHFPCYFYFKNHFYWRKEKRCVTCL